jgi:pilus assembly protein Flp/PilA
MKRFLINVMADDSGQDLIEYALIAALIALGAVIALNVMANSVKNAFNNIGTSVSTT